MMKEIVKEHVLLLDAIHQVKEECDKIKREYNEARYEALKRAQEMKLDYGEKKQFVDELTFEERIAYEEILNDLDYMERQDRLLSLKEDYLLKWGPGVLDGSEPICCHKKRESPCDEDCVPKQTE